MWKYFFTYESELPSDIGFPLFGFAHIAWLLFAVVVTIIILSLYKKVGEKKKRILECVAGCSMIFWIMGLTLYLICVHHMSKYELPLHVCSIMGILCGIHCLTKSEKIRDFIGQTLYAIGLPGTILALIYPNWTKYPPISFKAIEGFLFHIGIVIYVCMMLVSRKIIPELRKSWKVFLNMAMILIPVYLLDLNIKANYIFLLEPSPGSPLELVEQLLGRQRYLIGYTALMISGILLMELGYYMFTS